MIRCRSCARPHYIKPLTKEEDKLYRVFLLGETNKSYFCDPFCYTQLIEKGKDAFPKRLLTSADGKQTHKLPRKFYAEAFEWFKKRLDVVQKQQRAALRTSAAGTTIGMPDEKNRFDDGRADDLPDGDGEFGEGRRRARLRMFSIRSALHTAERTGAGGFAEGAGDNEEGDDDV